MDMSDLTDQKSKILAIDDTPANLHLLIEIFNPREYIVFPARNGAVALSRLQYDLPDLILMDINMPEMNGFELCRILKKDSKTRDIPVIFISGRDDSAAIIEGFSAGGVDYVTKPFKSSEVLARVNAHLMLKKYRELLKRQNMQLQQEILVRNNVEMELQKKNLEINERLEELQRAQSNLILQAKMAGIGQLAAGVAHEINNPLGFVVSNHHILDSYIQRIHTSYDKMDKKDIDYILKDAKAIIEESGLGLKRIRRIVAALLSFSNDGQPDDHTLCDLNGILETALEVAGSEISKAAVIEKQFGDLPEIIAIRGQLGQVFMNLLMNAFQAVKDERTTRTDYSGMIRIYTFFENGMVGCSVTDNGARIPAAIQDRMFEPFFTTRGIGEGTGIGLSTAYDIVVNRHYGKLYYSEIPGGEKSFTFLLPVRPPNDVADTLSKGSSQ